jgi:sec-independent protein translocase protein TatC
LIADHPPELGKRQPDWDQKEMPFTEHLRELRNRLIVTIATIGALALLLFWPSQFVIIWLKNEYLGNIPLHAFSPTDVISTEFKFSIYGAIVLGLPLIVYQVWMFIVPAFNPKTRNVVYAYTTPSVFLALVGIAFCHFVIIKRVLTALLGITQAVAEETFGVESTLNIILLTFLAFAIVFQTPMVMIALARIGLVNVTMLRTYRRYAAMGMLVFGGVAAPDGNPITMLLIAGPMYGLYEMSIWIIVVLEKSWKQTPAA